MIYSARFDTQFSEFLAHNLVELESCGSVANMVVACAYELFDENPKRKHVTMVALSNP